MRRLLTLAAVTCAVSTQVVLAYLSPTEVFPGLDVPAQEFSSAYSESSSEISTIEASSSSTHSAAPIFYKGGERVPQHPNPTSQPAKEEPEENIFMEEQTPEPTPEPEPTVSPEEELTDEELLHMQEQALAEEEALQEEGEEPKLSAPTRRPNAFSTIVSSMKYGIGLIGLVFAGYFYWTFGKQKSQPKQSNINVPQASPMVEESSQRLEQALKAMDEDKQ